MLNDGRLTGPGLGRCPGSVPRGFLDFTAAASELSDVERRVRCATASALRVHGVGPAGSRNKVQGTDPRDVKRFNRRADVSRL